MTTTLDEALQDCMHGFEDEVPIHGGKVDILQLNSRTWRAIEPAYMSKDKTLDIVHSRQFFNKRHVTPDVDDLLSRAVLRHAWASLLRERSAIDAHGMSRDERCGIRA